MRSACQFNEWLGEEIPWDLSLSSIPPFLTACILLCKKFFYAIIFYSVIALLEMRTYCSSLEVIKMMQLCDLK